MGATRQTSQIRKSDEEALRLQISNLEHLIQQSQAALQTVVLRIGQAEPASSSSASAYRRKRNILPNTEGLDEFTMVPAPTTPARKAKRKLSNTDVVPEIRNTSELAHSPDPRRRVEM